MIYEHTKNEQQYLLQLFVPKIIHDNALHSIKSLKQIIF